MRTLTLLLCLALAACATATAQAAPAAAAPAPDSRPDSLRMQEARVDCWAKVEKQRGLRNIDGRIAFVDKCVADALNQR
jgi:hypothetical protein